jgi:2-methylaconitate cis-trans-isomerase PrpF
VIGSLDPYHKHSDGIGGATSSTSKGVILLHSQRPGCEVDYLFDAVTIDAPQIDWSGNCGNLSAAVGPAAIRMGSVTPAPE